MTGHDDADRIREWLETKRPGTQKNYGGYLTRFLTFSDVAGPNALLQIRQDTMKSDDLDTKRTVEELAGKWAIHLQAKGLHGPTIRVGLRAVRSFMRRWSLPLGEIPFKPDDKIAADAIIPTLAQVGSMIETRTRVRDKFLICGLLQSGLAVGDFLGLTWEDGSAEFGSIKKQLQAETDNGFIHIRLNRAKTSVPFSCFFGSATVAYLREIKAEGYDAKGRILTMKSRQAERVVIAAALAAGVLPKGRTKRKVRLSPHCLREKMTLNLKLLGRGAFAEFLSGHKPGPMDRAYFAVASMTAQVLASWFKSFEPYVSPNGTEPTPEIQVS